MNIEKKSVEGALILSCN